MPIEQGLVDEALREATKRGETLDYFFDQLKSPAWIEPLRERGFFRDAPPQTVDQDRLVRAPAWSESRFLARVAARAPDLVVEVISTIDTNNERVVEDFVDAGLALPPANAEIIARLVRHWISERDYLYYLLPRKIIDLVFRLAQEDAFGTALDLMKTLFEPLPAVGSNVWVTSPRSRFSAWEYDQHLQRVVADLIPDSPRPILAALVDLLGRALDLLREASPSSDSDASRAWRVRIGDDRDRASEVEEALTSALRDASVAIRLKRLLSDRELLEALLTREDELLRRVAMYSFAKPPELDIDVVRPLVVDAAELTDGEPSPEYRDLLTIAAPRLEPDEVHSLAEAVMRGPDLDGYRERARRFGDGEPTDEQVAAHQARWQIGRLSLLADALPANTRADYDALVAEHGPAEIPVSWEVRTFMGPKSPRTAEELTALNDRELLAYLRAWRQPDQFGDEPSIEGLARAMSVVTERDPGRISQLAPQLRDVAPAYIQWILHGFDLAVGAERQFEWPPLFDLMLWVTAQPREIPGGRGDEYADLDPGWVWTRKEIAGLLERGLNSRGECAISIDLRGRVWEILVTIADDPEPTPEYEQRYGGQNMDPTTLSLNTTRPRALRAVIAYAIWVYHSRYGDEQAVDGFSNEIPEVRELLRVHLDVERDPASSVRAVFGQHYANFVALDSAWAGELRDSIFPMKDSPLREAAWGSHIIFTPPYNNVLAMLREQYRRSAELAAADRHGFKWINGNPAEKLGEHLATFYWRGVIGLDDELFTLFWSNSSANALGHVVEFLGRSAREVQLTEEIKERLVEFWEWVSATTGAEDASVVLSGFAWWFTATDLPVDWRVSQLEALLSRNIQPEPAYLVAEQLSFVAQDNPLAAVRALRLLIEQGDTWAVDAWRSEVEEVLRAATRSSDQEAMRVADATLDWLLARGYREFRSLVESGPSGS